MEATKYVQTEFEIRDLDLKKIEETRTIPFVISTATKDRHKTVLNMDSWKLDSYNRNPIVGYQHNVYGDNLCVPPNPDDVIGKAINTGVDTYKGVRSLMSEVVFEPKELNETAEKVFRKILWGSLRATSVGFLPVGQGREETTKDGDGNVIDRTYFFGGQELLEFSIVNIPSNPDAVRKSLTNHTNAALQFVSRLLPDYSIKDLRQMKIQDVMDMVEKKYIVPEQLEEVVEQAASKRGNDPSFYKLKLNSMKLKNGQA
jgi:hypothetical protein